MNTKIIAKILLMGSLLAASFSASAQVKIDDTGTQLLSPIVRMNWEDPIPVRGAVTSSDVVGEFVVRVRLNTAPWKGQVGRIYLTSPTPPTGPMHVAWRSMGVLQDGQLVSGQRVLVYAGVISQDVIVETMKFSLRTDGNKLSTQQSVEFNFEMDVGGVQ